MTSAAEQIARRRTFAIISHPDAGKTTLTERLLRAGGAIQLAGNVRAKGERRRTRSDWMGIERERGISVVTSVMTFEYAGCIYNLLDTPGHEDFSEDTYRTLTAVDSAVMVIDAAKGIEARTRKLFEICRLRDIPIITFVNKMDRESRDPFDLLDEVATTLALDTSPATWPVGRAIFTRATSALPRTCPRPIRAWSPSARNWNWSRPPSPNGTATASTPATSPPSISAAPCAKSAYAICWTRSPASARRRAHRWRTPARYRPTKTNSQPWSSRYRRTWIPTIGTAWPSRASVPAVWNAA